MKINRRSSCFHRWATRRAVSFFEVVLSIAVLGVLASILIPIATNIVPGSKMGTAKTNLEQLNQAVLKFNHANWELSLSPDGSTSDEEAIFRSLQYRDATTPAAGSPYIDASCAFFGVNDSESYRASWNGRMFELLPPGTDGAGIDLLRMSATGANVEFPEDYHPVGASHE